MWVSEFEIDGTPGLLGSMTKAANVTFIAYPTSYHHFHNFILVHFIGFVCGSENERDVFHKNLLNHERVIKAELHNNFLVLQIKESKAASAVYNPEIFCLRPVEIRSNGQEFWSLGSWNKDNILATSKFMLGNFAGKLLKVRDVPIDDFLFIGINPKLSPQQRRAVFLAIEHGYYEYPRHITLNELAKLMDVSFSTYQMHLRKAEQKLMPFLFNKFERALDGLRSMNLSNKQPFQ